MKTYKNTNFVRILNLWLVNSKVVFSLFVLLCLIIPWQKTLANAAQPGVWTAGGTVYTMLYPEDSASFKKVQMQRESIYIQLYKGYAVVKGTYLFRNTSKEKLNFKMGYPVNGIYGGGSAFLNDVRLDSLSKFKIKAKDQWLPLLTENNSKSEIQGYNIVAFSDNWISWQMTFEPEEIQTVEVYFIVNTNDASVRKGYSVNKRNAFIYLLESGRVWKNPIEKGDFYIQLKDGLTNENMHGLSQGFNFKYDTTNRIFHGTKTNLTPTPKDNLVTTYYKNNEAFDFSSIIAHSDQLFSDIDEMSQLPLDSYDYTPIEIDDPYKVVPGIGAKIFDYIFQFIFYVPFIIGGLVLVFLIRAVYKRVKT